MRWVAACASLLLALSANAQDKPKKPEPSKQPEFVVPKGGAIEVDGRIDDESLKDAAHLVIRRGKDKLADVWIHRHQRQLHFAGKSKLPANGVGVRFNITDPVSGRKIVILLMPMNPPRSPLAIFRLVTGRAETSVSASTCDLRFDLKRKDGFHFELRVPLDLIEIARAKKHYLLSAELWDLATNRMIAGYPMLGEGALSGRGRAKLMPAGDWGADVPLSVEGPPPNAALALLEQIQASRASGAGILQVHTGHADGQRKDGPLRKLQDQLAELMVRYPDYLSLHTNLVRVLRSRNRFAETLETLDGIPKAFPFMKGSQANSLARIEILYVTGRYDEALKLVEKSSKQFAKRKSDDLVRGLKALARDWKLEQRIRSEEAKRDDLPRVRFKTNRGSFVIELFEDDAPNGVANMIQLVENGFYDGTRFHWVSGGGRVVGGDPNSRDEDPFNDGYGDPGYLIESEPGRRLQFPFTVAYADKRHRKRTEGCAFMIHITPLPSLDGTNTVIGRIIEGHETVLALEYYDRIETAAVVRKRPHEYKVVKRP
jgi:cyclophilin family peptidyl-prolyl cis-trans isomerase